MNNLNSSNDSQSYHKEINNIKPDFKKYNDIFDFYKVKSGLSNQELNAVRHMGASIYYTSNYGKDMASKLGTGYELLPQFTSASEPGDTKIDLYNNYLGRVEGEKHKNLTPLQSIMLADSILKNTNKPALNYNDERAMKMQYPATIWQKAVATFKN